VFRFEGGKMAEHWAAFEALDMLQQIGMVLPHPRTDVAGSHLNASGVEVAR